MSSSRIRVAFIALFTASQLYTAQARAHTIVETDELSVELRALAEAGYIVADDVHSRSTGPHVGMARLSTRATYNDIGRVFVQYEAASGEARLLDLLGILYITDWFHLRLGYFKTPTSVDYNISTARKPFPTRALVTELTPRRRAGAELLFEAPLGSATGRLHTGVFSPRPLGVPADRRLLLASRAEILWPFGLGLHLGYSDHFDTVDRDEPGEPFFIAQPRLVDIAATFRTTRWWAHVEAVIAPHRDPAYVPAGVYAAVAHRFGDLQTQPTLEPILGYDLVIPDVDLPFHRIRAGVNTYLLDHRVVPNVHYEMTIDADGRLGHAAYALLRVGI
ncbi:MAG: hypothetical protein ACNA8W_19000 [Bradymonadaceae bacterium]